MENRALQPGDIVHVLYDKKIAKGIYRLGRILTVHPDAHGIVRTVTVGMRHQDRREAILPYVPRDLDQYRLGVQRVAVILPVEEQTEVVQEVGGQEETDGSEDSAQLEAVDVDVSEKLRDTEELELSGEIDAVQDMKNTDGLKDSVQIETTEVLEVPDGLEEVDRLETVGDFGSAARSEVLDKDEDEI